MPQQKFYAVRKGRNPGIFNSWTEASQQVVGFPGAVHKSFKSRPEAVAWLGGNTSASDALAQLPHSWKRRADDDDDSYVPQPKKTRAISPAGRIGYAVAVPSSSYLHSSSAGDFLTASTGFAVAEAAPRDDVFVDSNSGSSSGVSEHMLYRLEFDGASRGNPGIAGCGAVLYEDATNVEVFQCSWPLQRGSTNNEAEYEGLLRGLKEALALGVKRVVAQGDSKLVCNQVQGSWKINFEHLRKLREQVCEVTSQLSYFQIRHVLRDRNKAADALSNRAIDEGYTRKVADFVSDRGAWSCLH